MPRHNLTLTPPFSPQTDGEERKTKKSLQRDCAVLSLMKETGGRLEAEREGKKALALSVCAQEIGGFE
jgi:hypothetical protein